MSAGSILRSLSAFFIRTSSPAFSGSSLFAVITTASAPASLNASISRAVCSLTPSEKVPAAIIGFLVFFLTSRTISSLSSVESRCISVEWHIAKMLATPLLSYHSSILGSARVSTLLSAV